MDNLRRGIELVKMQLTVIMSLSWLQWKVSATTICSGRSFSFESSVAVILTPVTSVLLYKWMISTTAKFTCYNRGPPDQVSSAITGCLWYPGASTIGSQLLDGDCSHGWQILASQPWAPTQKGEQAPVTLCEQWKRGREVGGEGGSLKDEAHELRRK